MNSPILVLITMYMYVLFTMCMNTRTCFVDIVLIVRYQIDATMAHSQCMKAFQFSLKVP